jgi:hypothetical protein
VISFGRPVIGGIFMELMMSRKMIKAKIQAKGIRLKALFFLDLGFLFAILGGLSLEI